MFFNYYNNDAYDNVNKNKIPVFNKFSQNTFVDKLHKLATRKQLSTFCT